MFSKKYHLPFVFNRVKLKSSCFCTSIQFRLWPWSTTTTDETTSSFQWSIPYHVLWVLYQYIVHIRNTTRVTHTSLSLTLIWFYSFSIFGALVRSAQILTFVHLFCVVRYNPARISQPLHMYMHAPTGFLVKVSGTSFDSSFSTLDPPSKNVQKMMKTPNFRVFWHLGE